eukprot:3957262-Pyramimonas_sp.AAC.2
MRRFRIFGTLKNTEATGHLRKYQKFERGDAENGLVLQADKDILEHIVYEFNDQAMMEMLRPSLEEAFVIQNQQVALDYIGKRGSTVGVTREKRINPCTPSGSRFALLIITLRAYILRNEHDTGGDRASDVGASASDVAVSLAREGDSAEGAAAARGHRRLLRDEEGVLLWVHHPPSARLRLRPPEAGGHPNASQPPYSEGAPSSHPPVVGSKAATKGTG